jgi:Arc/MetJ-type ribon-helix-helix transcriptional regulator
MKSPHESKYAFAAPRTIREAKDRMKILYRDIRNIEKQLGDGIRYDRSGQPVASDEYRNWSSRIRASLVYKQVEYAELKDWIAERRRELDARKAGIEDPNNPRELLRVARLLLRDVLDGKPVPEIAGPLYTAIDQHLIHAA